MRSPRPRGASFLASDPRRRSSAVMVVLRSPRNHLDHQGPAFNCSESVSRRARFQFETLGDPTGRYLPPDKRQPNERVTEMFGQLRVGGYQKKGMPVRSQTAKAVQKRKERVEGEGSGQAAEGTVGEVDQESPYNPAHNPRVRGEVGVPRIGCPSLPHVRVPEASFDWYQPAEASRLLESAANGWERAVLMFPLHTGARMGEQRAIRWSASILRCAGFTSAGRHPSGSTKRRRRRATGSDGSI